MVLSCCLLIDTTKLPGNIVITGSPDKIDWKFHSFSRLYFSWPLMRFLLVLP